MIIDHEGYRRAIYYSECRKILPNAVYVVDVSMALGTQSDAQTESNTPPCLFHISISKLNILKITLVDYMN